MLINHSPTIGSKATLGPTQARFTHEIGCALRHHKVHKIVVVREWSYHLIALGIGLYTLEVGLFSRCVDSLQAAVHIYGDVALLVNLLQTRCVVGHVVELLAACVVVHINLVEIVVLAGVIPREQTYLLGRTATLVLGVGIAEDTLATLLAELFHCGPRLCRSLGTIDGVGITLTNSLVSDTLDAFPIILYTRYQDQKIILNDSIFGRIDSVLCGVDKRSNVLNPFYARRHTILLRLPYIVGLIYTAGDECESGLIVLTVTWVDDSNVGILQRSFELRSHTYTSRTASNNYDTTFGIALCCVSLVGTSRQDDSCRRHYLNKLGSRYYTVGNQFLHISFKFR